MALVARAAGATDVGTRDFMVAPDQADGGDAEPTAEETAQALNQLFGLGS